MPKFVVISKDSKQVFGPGEELFARHDRASVVRDVVFIQRHVASGQLQIVAQVTDEATDVALADQWPKLIEAADGDVEEAARAFAKRFSLEKPSKAAPTPAPSPAPTPAPAPAAADKK